MNQHRKLLVGGVMIVAGLGVLLFRQSKPSTPTTTPTPATEPADNDGSRRLESEARTALAARPDDGPAALKLAKALRQQKRYPEAEVALAQAAKLGVPEADGRREAVLLFSTRDWPPQVEGMMQRVVRDNPDDVEVLLAVANSYAAKGRFVEAERLFTLLLARDPNHVAWRFHRGVARMQAGDYTPAVEDLRPMVAAEPSNYQARLALAHSLLGDARMPEAEQELSACRRLRPEAAEPLVGLAKCAIEQDNLDAAEKLLTQAKERDRNSTFVLEEFAALYLRRQKLDAAIATLKQLVAIAPNNRQAHLQLSQALLATGNPTEAQVHERRYQELDKLEEQRLAARRGMR